jgi:hypothetical protein
VTDAMTPEVATALRRPFPAASIGKLPKGGAMLDYVGHAAVTDRLLTIDPHWSWEPFAIGPDGLPALDAGRNLWIRLTICGVTRIGVGDGKSAKECIGDAIRNAAMRFGVALDLWAKEDLVEFAQAARREPTVTTTTYTQAPPETFAPDPEPVTTTALKPGTRGHLFALFNQKGVAEDQQLAGANTILGTDYTSRSQFTEEDAQRLITALKSKPDAALQAQS